MIREFNNKILKNCVLKISISIIIFSFYLGSTKQMKIKEILLNKTGLLFNKKDPGLGDKESISEHLSHGSHGLMPIEIEQHINQSASQYGRNNTINQMGNPLVQSGFQLLDWFNPGSGLFNAFKPVGGSMGGVPVRPETQPTPQPTFQRTTPKQQFIKPTQQSTVITRPHYVRPEYGGPEYGGPEYEGPEYVRPEYGKPEYGRPVNGRPVNERPEYVKPEYVRPEYGKPQYGRPEFGTPDQYQEHFVDEEEEFDMDTKDNLIPPNIYNKWPHHIILR